VARELGLLRFQAKDCPGALEVVAKFEAATRTAETLNALGLFQTCLGHRKEALQLFRKSLTIQPNQPAVVQSIQLIEKAPLSAN
jgi:Flp pilus assembly protein TadD